MTKQPSETTVLVVEDNGDNLFIVTDLLRAVVGVRRCEGCAAGWQMFKMLREQPDLQPDLILLDIQIPGEDGYGVLQRIRSTPALQHVKVVALTANVMPYDVQRAEAAGLDGFIGKPISSRRFPQQIERILAGESVWEPR